MSGLRDIIRKMPGNKKDLENYVLNHSPEIKEAVERDPSNGAKLERIVDESFDKYSKYVGGWTSKLSGAGHVVGHASDAYFGTTGDIVGALGGKFLGLLAQVPEKAYSLVYAARTGNYMDAVRNIFEGAVSYLPFATVVDQGLSRIVKKRMVKDVKYRMEKEIDSESTWDKRVYHSIKDAYPDAEDQSRRIIRPSRDLKKAA